MTNLVGENINSLVSLTVIPLFLSAEGYHLVSYVTERELMCATTPDTRALYMKQKALQNYFIKIVFFNTQNLFYASEKKCSMSMLCLTKSDSRF